MQSTIRTGFGYDVHALKEGGKLTLGGVTIPYSNGLTGHSDADVVLHAIMDALLGAAALGDIGTHFPDTDTALKGADSRKLLREVRAKLEEASCRIGNIDVTLVAEAPKIGPYINQMRTRIASDLQVDTDQVSVKATTSEGIGFVGREEGMAAQAVATIMVES